MSVKQNNQFKAIFLIGLILFSGCSAPIETTRTETLLPTTGQPIVSLPPASTVQDPKIPPATPIEITIEFPNGAPALNQVAELTCIIVNHEVLMKEMSLEIVLPDGLLLVSGQLSWVGRLPEGYFVQAINAKIKAIQVGNWTATVKRHINVIAPGGFNGDGIGLIYVLVSDNSAKWSTTRPPWLGDPLTPSPPFPIGTIPTTSPLSQ